jgi:hypothetical protein
MALDLIEQALPALGSETPEGKKLMSALSSLTGLLGPKKARTGELQQAEILQLSAKPSSSWWWHTRV